MTKAYCKINIGLNIDNQEYPLVNKHKINSIFYLYKDLYDEIEISENSFCDEINYFCNQQKVEYPNCLVKETLNYLRARKLIHKYYSIKIIKNIPVQSGLGGGSSDAAIVIKKIVPHLECLDMLDIAIKLGSDIPFFLSGYNCALVSSFGEQIQPIDLSTNLKFNLHLTKIKFSTKDVFTNYCKKYFNNSIPNDFQKIIVNLNSNNLYNLNIINDLLDSVKDINNIWFNLYQDIKKQHKIVFMSGSGGTIVSIDKPKRIRTRYAPSPTGYFHIGGARTAIFNYLFAKHCNGDFIVRIEDTDVARSVENGVESQLNNLNWLNVKIDESVINPGKYGPYVQTQKLLRYQQLANDLLASGKAYYCFCDENKLEEERQKAIANHQTPKYSRHCLHLSPQEQQELINKNVSKVIRLKIDESKNYKWDDLIRGEISVPGSAMTDPVILKSNLIPMYNFAVVVDDYDMEISHILRGEEHISNTPYQIAIKEALGFDNDIKFGHLSVIIDESGKKLSKRNKFLKQFIEEYKDLGFLPEAVFNFLALLSWNSNDNREIFSHEELIKSFNIENLSKSPTFFDYKKMLWIGNEYFKKMDEKKYLDFCKPFIKVSLTSFLEKNLNDIILMFKNQISYADQLNQLIKEYILKDCCSLTKEELEIVHKNKDVVKAFYGFVKDIKKWQIDEIKSAINNTKLATSKTGQDLFMPIRIVCTGLMHGPEIAKILFFKEQKTILVNIDKILNSI